MGLNEISEFVNLEICPITNVSFIDRCNQSLRENGVLTIPGFLKDNALNRLIAEAKKNQDKAYYSSSTHNVYLTPKNDSLPEDHVFNLQIISSKGCITTDQISEDSGLKVIYRSVLFKKFIAQIVQENDLFEYEDPFSSINVHYAEEGQELGWHFDNSSFAVTLLLQKPTAGGAFQYVKNIRDAESGEMGYQTVGQIISGHKQPSILKINPGTLVLFRGKNSIHRVTPTRGNKTRILVVFAYNSKPGISLSESAQKTFYGKVSSQK